MEHPFMWDYMKEGGADTHQSQPAKGSKPHSPAASQESDEEGDNSDADDHALNELLHCRLELDETFDIPREEAFSYTLVGGKWTSGRSGVAYDFYRAFAKNDLPSSFCDLYGLVRSASFSTAKYTEEGCLVMIRSWLHRMNYLYTVWTESGCSATFQFSDADFQTYTEPRELALFEARATTEGVRARIRALRCIAPRRICS